VSRKSLYQYYGCSADSMDTLPFDPDEAADSLRLERYVSTADGMAGGASSKSLVRRAYYLVRSLLPVRVRRRLQRAYLNGWDQIPFPKWPVDFSCDDAMKTLMTALVESRGGGPVPFIWFWPEGHTSCAMLTHDVETAAGRDFCSKLMDIDERSGFKASYQVIPEKRYEVPDSFLESIRARGCEINVHDLNHDGHLFDDEDTFLARAKRVNHYAGMYGARGFRSAVMYRNLDWLDTLDFEYDMSVPNVAHLDPQRGGCCTVFPYFVGNIVELPLTTIQDYPLFNVLNDYSIDLWKKQIEMIQGYHGLISFNVHPDYLDTPRALDCYRQLLDHLSRVCASNRVWAALPGEVAAWWRLRSQLSLVERDGCWQVEGSGHERARVALARVTDGRLWYEVQSNDATG